MYGVVQFTTKEGGTTAVISSKWLTPRKMEVYWPPVKESKKYDKILQQCMSPDHNKWKVYNIERVLYETVDLDKAKKKLKIADETSDLQTAEEEITEDEPKRKIKRTRRYISTDGEEVDDEGLVRPPALTTAFTKYVDTNTAFVTLKEPPINVNDPNFISQEGAYDKITVWENPQTPIAEVDINTIPKDRTRYISGQTVKECNNNYPLDTSDLLNNIEDLLPTSTPKVANYTGFQEKMVSLLSHIKHQNEQILAMLTGTLKTTELDSDFSFPIKTEEGISATEQILQDREKYENLVKYIRSIGGHDLSNKVSRAMKVLLLDSVAAKYNFYGKRSKKAFSELRIQKCLVDAVNHGTPEITAKLVEDQIKIWLKHAPERNKKKSII